jgi:peptide deformylase
MAVREIMQWNKNPILREKSKKVVRIDKELRRLLRDMGDTLRSVNAIGLSAVQIGIPKRVVLLRNGVRLHHLINPVIMGESGGQLVTERCLSVPGVRGKVRRPERILIRALDSRGKTIFLRGQGFLAAALCHEIDHLDGVLFIDKAVPGTLVRSRYVNPL